MGIRLHHREDYATPSRPVVLVFRLQLRGRKSDCCCNKITTFTERQVRGLLVSESLFRSLQKSWMPETFWLSFLSTLSQKLSQSFLIHKNLNISFVKFDRSFFNELGKSLFSNSTTLISWQKLTTSNFGGLIDKILNIFEVTYGWSLMIFDGEWRGSVVIYHFCPWPPIDGTKCASVWPPLEWPPAEWPPP